MQCPLQTRENAEVLLAYFDRTLDPEAMSCLERHAANCEACREMLRAQREVWEALDSWLAEDVSADFDERLFARIRRETSTGWWRRWIWALQPFPVRPAMAVAAACLVLVAGVLFRQPGELEPASSTTQAWTMEAVDVELVEHTLDDLEMLQQLGAADAAEEAPRSTL